MLLLFTLLACAPQEPPAPQDTSAVARPAIPVADDDRAQADEAWCTPELADRCAAAAERGLRWLQQQQLDTGCWTGLVGHKQSDDYYVLPDAPRPDAQRSKGEGHLGVTALCGMAFLAGGHLPDRGEYSDTVRLAQQFVVEHAQQSGLLRAAGTRMYSHAFGTLFLAEVHGMSADAATKDALERAVNMICDSQNQHGGWRYNPFDRNTDLSVTVCQLQALRAARNIGIRVPVQTIDRAMKYVHDSRVVRGRFEGLFYYKIYGRGAYQKDREYAINAAALTALSSAGVLDDDLSDPVLGFLERSYGPLASRYATHFYYWYGNYYAAQAFYQHGGARLRGFFGRMANDLLASQGPDGRWRNHTGPGDEFATAVACILLQMPRQYLPIFQR